MSSLCVYCLSTFQNWFIFIPGFRICHIPEKSLFYSKTWFHHAFWQLPTRKFLPVQSSHQKPHENAKTKIGIVSRKQFCSEIPSLCDCIAKLKVYLLKYRDWVVEIYLYKSFCFSYGIFFTLVLRLVFDILFMGIGQHLYYFKAPWHRKGGI